MITPAIPPRTAWGDFPDVVIHAAESAVKKHQAYVGAKAGDSDAAFALVSDTLSSQAVAAVLAIAAGRQPLLASAHAFERTGVNAIPEALADELARQTGFPVDASSVQVNVVGHTGADGYARLSRQAQFDGEVAAGQD